MSKENVMNFLKKMGEDDALKAKFKAAGSEDEALKVITGAGFDVTVEELKTTLTSMNSDELNEDELENVAGGGAIREGYDDCKYVANDVWNEVSSWGW